MRSKDPREDRNFRRIGPVLMRKAVLYTLLFIVVSVAVSVLVAHNREQARVSDLITRIRVSECGPMSEALWVADMRMLKIQLESLTRQPLVAFAGVREGESIVASAGAQPLGRVRSETCPLTFEYDGEVRKIGELAVTLTLRPVYRNAIRSGLLASLYPTAAILAVGFLLYASFHKLVIQRLLQISSYLRTFEAAGDSEPLELRSPLGNSSNWDELDDMARTINEMRERLVGHRRELEGAYAQVEREVQQKTQELQLANRTLKRQIDELEQTKRELTDADRIKTMFLANMSHELRTPLTGIVGIARLLERTGLDEKQGEYLYSIIHSGERQECTVRTSVSPSVPREVLGDAVRTAQILRNLLSNAVKFTPGGEVRIHVDLADTEGAPGRIRFSVQDNGVGIAEDALPRLFESFYQVDSSYSKKHEGTGLGLAMEAVVREDEGERHLGSLGVSGTSSVTRRKILVAEDNAINRLYIERFLQAEGHTVKPVANGFQAVEAAKEDPFDLILIDIQMPGLDGIEATKQIREFSQVPIIALTAYARPEEIESFYVQGMNRAVTKPINEGQLRDAIAGTS